MQEKNPLILDGDWNNFLTLQDEKLLIVKRKHPFLLIWPIIVTLFLAISFVSAGYYLFAIFFSSPTLFLSCLLSSIIISMSFLIKIVVDWYFHLYVVTDRKILEVSFAPLSAHVVNSVLLDQVNCTEIDIRTDGFINELIDMGDVVITFDRPTHQEEFIFSSIEDSRKIGAYLSDNLVGLHNRSLYMPIWYRPKSEKKYKFMEEIFPRPAV